MWSWNPQHYQARPEMTTGPCCLSLTPIYPENVSLRGWYFFGKCWGSVFKETGSVKSFSCWVSAKRSKYSKSLFQNPSQHLWKCAKQTLEDFFFFECFGINVLWDREERQSEMSLKIGLSSSFLVELILIFNTPSAIRRKERPLALSTDLFWAHLFFSCRHYIFSYVIHWLIFIIFLALWESESPLSFILI